MDPTPQTIAHAIAPAIHGHDEAGPLAEPVTLLTTKFVEGDKQRDKHGVVVTVPVWFALLEPHEDDAHFAQYSSAQEVRCVKANATSYQLRFPLAVFDLDYGGHKTRPTQEDFTNLVRTLWVVAEPTPNLVYPTRGGARILYHLDPLTDAAEFEDRLRTLMGLLKGQLDRRSSYQIDPACKDWTRPYRCPRVVRDGEVYHDTPVHQIHGDVMDMRKFKRQTRPQRAVPLTGAATFTGHDPWISARAKHIREGARNNTLYALFRFIRDKYREPDQEPWVAILLEKALAEGMPEREFWRTHQSAFGTKPV